MYEQPLRVAVRYRRTLLVLALLAVLLSVGAVGEAAAHGPCHANPGAVPDAVCNDLPSQHAPRG